jgi:hypothetical protein
MREAIRGHQRSSEVIRGHQRSSEVIKGHQRSSLLVQAKREQRRTELPIVHLEQPGGAMDVVAARDERSGVGTLVELRAHRFHLVCIALRDPTRSDEIR